MVSNLAKTSIHDKICLYLKVDFFLFSRNLVVQIFLYNSYKNNFNIEKVLNLLLLDLSFNKFQRPPPMKSNRYLYSYSFLLPISFLFTHLSHFKFPH